MTRRTRGPWTADGYFSAGLLLVLLTGVLVLVTSGDRSTAFAVAYIGGGVSSLVLLIGAVAKGVEVGIRASRD